MRRGWAIAFAVNLVPGGENRKVMDTRLTSDAALALNLSQPHIDVFVGISVRILGNNLSFSLILLLSVRLALDDAQHSARNGLANTTNLVDCDWIQSNNGCVHGCVHAPSLSIGAVASPLTPESLEYLIEAYNITEGLQEQGMRTRGSPFHEFC